MPEYLTLISEATRITKPIEKNIEQLSEKEKSITEVKEIIEFIQITKQRGICRYLND